MIVVPLTADFGALACFSLRPPSPLASRISFVFLYKGKEYVKALVL
jgi:hypothetical protein